jgi:hypothetical protein
VQYLFVLFGLSIFAVVCRGIILGVYFKTEWTYGILVLVSVGFVVLPRIMFSFVTAHYRRTSIALNTSELTELSASHVGVAENVADNDSLELNRTDDPPHGEH